MGDISGTHMDTGHDLQVGPGKRGIGAAQHNKS